MISRGFKNALCCFTSTSMIPMWPPSAARWRHVAPHAVSEAFSLSISAKCVGPVALLRKASRMETQPCLAASMRGLSSGAPWRAPPALAVSWACRQRNCFSLRNWSPRAPRYCFRLPSGGVLRPPAPVPEANLRCSRQKGQAEVDGILLAT